jgi:hypothetical protein
MILRAAASEINEEQWNEWLEKIVHPKDE